MDFTTSDGRVISIDKGGEQIENNTYGFEIEFCTHDSSVFAFTHVDVAEVMMKFAKRDEIEKWKIETDSGNVLELVTTPLRFNSTGDAYKARDIIIKTLYESVSPHEKSQTEVNALTFGQWGPQVRPALGAVASVCYNPVVFGDLAKIDIVKLDWEAVKTKLTQENVDDGINIKAALLRFLMNRNRWYDYVNDTVLCWSEKDWGRRYSSQVNMPMSLEGYFLYVVSRKLPRALARMERIKSVTDLGELGDLTLQQRVTTWFWLSLLADVCNMYLANVTDGKVSQIRALDAAAVKMLSLADLKFISFVFVMTSKILTGALGSLSEANQLGLQAVAWTRQSTQAMVEDKPASYEELLRSLGIQTTAWLEYHSSLKDLTGLWFKAALEDVMAKELMIPIDFYKKLSKILTDDKGQAWNVLIDGYVRIIKSKEWEALWENREGYSEDLEELKWDELKAAIVKVEAALAAKLENFAGWLEILGPSRERAASWFMLPDRKLRPFLHYSSAPPWEGRYDTMYPAIRVGDTPFWRYLIEHRNN